MSRTLDVLVDVEHGTVEGYRQGCRGTHCPAGDEFGLSCSRANSLAAGDWQYMKLVRRELKPREIAAAMNLGAKEQSKPKQKPPAPVDDVIEEEPMNARKQSGRITASAPSKEVRAWARSQGITVPERGTLPNAVIDAFNARGKGVQATDVKPAPTPEPIAEPVVEVVVSAKTEPVEPVIQPASVDVTRPDWSLPLAADDLRSIADAIDALTQVPRSVIELDQVPVLRPGGNEIIGEISYAAGFDAEDSWLGFTPRGAA